MASTFDAGTGGGSFRFRSGASHQSGQFGPLSIDLHVDSMNSSTKDMMNVMSKFMAMGLTLQQVVADTNLASGPEIQVPSLATSPYANADVAVLSEEHVVRGLDGDNTRMMGDTRVICELTIRAGDQHVRPRPYSLTDAE